MAKLSARDRLIDNTPNQCAGHCRSTNKRKLLENGITRSIFARICYCAYHICAPVRGVWISNLCSVLGVGVRMRVRVFNILSCTRTSQSSRCARLLQFITNPPDSFSTQTNTPRVLCVSLNTLTHAHTHTHTLFDIIYKLRDDDNGDFFSKLIDQKFTCISRARVP